MGIRDTERLQFVDLIDPTCGNNLFTELIGKNKRTCINEGDAIPLKIVRRRTNETTVNWYSCAH